MTGTEIQRRGGSLYLIADMDTADRQQIDLEQAVRQFVRAGGRMVSLRCGQAADRRCLTLAQRLSGLLASVRGVFLVHRRLDLAVMSAADGVHLPSTGFGVRRVRQFMVGSVIVGRSCHERSEVLDCDDGQWSFVTLGPLFESISKPGYGPAMTMEAFAETASRVDLGVYALGGVMPDNAAACLKAGAAGVAVVGGILGADSPFEATRRYLKAIRSAACDGPRSDEC